MLEIQQHQLLLDILITEQGVDKKLLQPLTDAGIEIIQV